MTEIFVRWILLFCLIEGCVAMDSMYVKQGSNVVLKCPYTPVIFWSDPATKEMFAIGLVTNKNMDMSPRLTITEDFYLIIHNFTSTDVRTYRCTCQQGKQQPKTFSFEPLLYQRPSGMKINGKKEIKFLDVDEGTKCTLNCSVDSGKPSGTIEWKRNDQHLLFGVHHVSFTFIPKESDNSDNYTCTAQNPATDYPLTKTVQLFVNLRPRVILTAYPSTNVHEGQLLTLTCNYTSNIKYGTIQWLKKIETSSNTSEHIESENRSISFDKVERNNMGQYICQVTNRIGTDSSKINITVSFPPTTFKQKVIYNINGEYGKLSTIKIDINCYPSLMVSWAQTAGGKLGIWTTKPNGKAMTLFNHNFSLVSTIFPTKEEHFGSYHVIVRNSRGSLQLMTQLILKEESKVNVFPHAPVCSTSDGVKLFCNISSKEYLHWNVIWEHYFNGVHIRTLQAKTDQQNSSLDITFCDFKDEGQYMCVWTSQNRRIVGTTSLTVNDRPVITKKEIVEDESCIILSVYFHDNTNSSLISWFVNDEKITENRTAYQLTVKRTEVTLVVYEKLVRTNGICAELVLTKSFLTNEMLVNCEIRNRFGSIAAVFRKSELEDYLRNATSILKKSSDINIPLTLDYSLIPQDITIATNTPEQFQLKTGSIYIAFPGLFVLFLCTVIFTVYRFKLARKFCVRHVYEIRSEEATQNDQEQDAVHHGAIYEIIENSHYLTVEWQNNEMSNSESEIEDRGDVISFSYVEPVNGNSYDEITSTYYEDVDWRNSIVSSEESCPELDFSGVNIETTENVGKAPGTCPKVLFTKREENHGETESDIIQNYSRKTSSSAAQSHIYVTVLSNE